MSARRLGTLILALAVSIAIFNVVSELRRPMHPPPNTTSEASLPPIHVPVNTDLSDTLGKNVRERGPPTNASSVEIAPRAFAKWSATIPLPCLPLEHNWSSVNVQQRPTTTGILFIRPPKVASTSACSVTLRIASRLAQRKWARNSSSSTTVESSQLLLCKNRFDHASAGHMMYDRRNHEQSFLWTMIRDPTTRALSHYAFFHGTLGLHNVSDDDLFETYFRRHRRGFESYLISYLSLVPFRKGQDDPAIAIDNILDSYNFIGE